MKLQWNRAVAAASVAVSLVFFFVALNSPLSAMFKLALSLVILWGCGTSVASAFGFECYAGMFLLRSQKGLGLIDSIARKHPALWQYFAEVGMVVGYGSLSYFLMEKKKRSIRSLLSVYVPGVFLLIIVSMLVPLAMTTLLSQISGGSEFATAGAKFQAATSQLDFFRYLSFAALCIGGISLVATMSVVAYAGVVAAAIAGALAGNHAPLAATSPGGIPIIPGINLDLVQGVLALAVVLIVHEGMHGILARLYRLPLKSAGLVFFGFLPFGAFVDIDEKKLFAEKKARQNAVLVAGTAANFATAILFLALLLAFASLFGDAQAAMIPAWAKYVARFLALCFALNAVVASVNLIPLPFFDGHYLMKNIVGNRHVATAVTYIVGLAFLLTLFPWVLR